MTDTEMPFNYRVGTQTFGVQYQFADETKLVETARAILGMGSDILKCGFGSGRRGDDTTKSLRDVVEHEPSMYAGIGCRRRRLGLRLK